MTRPKYSTEISSTFYGHANILLKSPTEICEFVYQNIPSLSTTKSCKFPPEYLTYISFEHIQLKDPTEYSSIPDRNISNVLPHVSNIYPKSYAPPPDIS